MTTRLLGGLAPALSGAVINEKRLRARGVHADAEAGEFVVPGNPGLVVGLERIDGARGQRELDPCDAFGGVMFHGGIIAWLAQ